MNPSTSPTHKMKDLGEMLWVALLAAIGGLWTLLNMRIGRTEKDVETQRENVKNIYAQMKEHEEKDAERFEKLIEKVNESHLTLIAEIRSIDRAGRR